MLGLTLQTKYRLSNLIIKSGKDIYIKRWIYLMPGTLSMKVVHF